VQDFSTVCAGSAIGLASSLPLEPVTIVKMPAMTAAAKIAGVTFLNTTLSCLCRPLLINASGLDWFRD
jgi:hypothetical protein